jgi:hypothetical protein
MKGAGARREDLHDVLREFVDFMKSLPVSSPRPAGQPQPGQ